MSPEERRDDEPAGAPAEPPGDNDDIEQSLNAALNDLERMLQRHRGAGPEPAPRGAPEEEGYEVPLLEDVVVPGVAMPEAPPVSREADEPLADDEPTLRRRLAARLASEVEVIVQDRIEAAVAKACEEIREQVRNHMDITLPEIVEELTQVRRRRED